MIMKHVPSGVSEILVSVVDGSVSDSDVAVVVFPVVT